MTIGFSDGNRLYAMRYASAEVNTLFVSEDAAVLGMLYPESPGTRATLQI